MEAEQGASSIGDKDIAESRTLLDQLITDSNLYTNSKDYKDLLEFTIRLRNFAPFNAMLLQVQKPGLTYAASAYDWRLRFGRYPKKNARPLIILWPFGPVVLVYDVQDTEGKDLPEDVSAFLSVGEIDELRFVTFPSLLEKKNIMWEWFDGGDGKAGSISLINRAKSQNETSLYRMNINRNHDKPVQFTTLTHELGHLFLGHLGPDKKLRIPKRPKLNIKQVELEAESVAYLVCKRNGISPKSETYLSGYVDNNDNIEQFDLYQIMRAAGQIETILGLTYHTKYE